MKKQITTNLTKRSLSVFVCFKKIAQVDVTTYSKTCVQSARSWWILAAMADIKLAAILNNALDLFEVTQLGILY